MEKIGDTLAGSVLVEMTIDEYEALQRLQGLYQNPPDEPTASSGTATSMTHADRVTYVADRLKKLQPKKRDGVIRSIEAMFQFTGGISSTDVDNVVKALVKQNFFSIDDNGKVAYQ